jgi:hypothetical protein
VTAWVDEKRPSFDTKVVAWREEKSFLKLNTRADDAETYALAVFDLAIATADEASQAALEALLARCDATAAALPPGLGKVGGEAFEKRCAFNGGIARFSEVGSRS